MTLQEFYAQIGGSYADTVRRLWIRYNKLRKKKET